VQVDQKSRHTATHCDTHCNTMATRGRGEGEKKKKRTLSPGSHVDDCRTLSQSNTPMDAAMRMVTYVVAVCCSKLQYVAVCCSVLQYVAECCSVLQ